MKSKTYGFVCCLIGMLFCIWLPPASAEVVDRIVAIVDTEIITLFELEREVSPYIKKIESQGYTEEKKEEMIKGIRKQVLDRLIENSLAAQEAKKYQLGVTDADIDGAIKNIKQSRGLSDDQLNAALAKENMSMESYRESLREDILRARLIQVAVKSKVVISEEEIKTRYERDQEKYRGTKKYHLRNILADTQDVIQAIRRKLEEGGDFIRIATEYSMAPNAKEGGDLGMFSLEEFPPEIRQIVSGLSEGDNTDVVSTALGYQIFHVQEIVTEGSKTLEEASDGIHGELYQEKVEEKFKTWLGALKEKAHIKIML